MINYERLEDLRRSKEASNLSIEAEKERIKLSVPFAEFMESAFGHINAPTGSKDENVRFTRSDMFLAFRYGYKEATNAD